jgi:hypothetical protein
MHGANSLNTVFRFSQKNEFSWQKIGAITQYFLNTFTGVLRKYLFFPINNAACIDVLIDIEKY